MEESKDRRVSQTSDTEQHGIYQPKRQAPVLQEERRKSAIFIQTHFFLNSVTFIKNKEKMFV